MSLSFNFYIIGINIPHFTESELQPWIQGHCSFHYTSAPKRLQKMMLSQEAGQLKAGVSLNTKICLLRMIPQICRALSWPVKRLKLREMI